LDEDETLRAATEAEAAGQRVFVRYGEGNHFAGDPLNLCAGSDPALALLRLCETEYRAAAVQFDRAAAALESSSRQGDAGERLALVRSLRERARFCRAQAFLLAGSAASARDELKGADLRLPESHNVLGIASLELADFASAQQHFHQAKAQAPHWPYPRHNLALTHVERGAYGAAEREYREAIEAVPLGGRVRSDPESPCFHGREVAVAARPYLYYNLGVLYQRLNRLSDAQRQFCMAQESFRAQIASFDSPAQPDPAMAKLFRAAAQRNLADAHNSLGVVLASRGKRAPAEAWLRKAARAGSAEAAANLAQLERNQVRKGAEGTTR
jgi:tetratricopeptide (TPR) repeat protein